MRWLRALGALVLGLSLLIPTQLLAMSIEHARTAEDRISMLVGLVLVGLLASLANIAATVALWRAIRKR